MINSNLKLYVLLIFVFLNFSADAAADSKKTIKWERYGQTEIIKEGQVAQQIYSSKIKPEKSVVVYKQGSTPDEFILELMPKSGMMSEEELVSEEIKNKLENASKLEKEKVALTAEIEATKKTLEETTMLLNTTEGDVKALKSSNDRYAAQENEKPVKEVKPEQISPSIKEINTKIDHNMSEFDANRKRINEISKHLEWLVDHNASSPEIDAAKSLLDSLNSKNSDLLKMNEILKRDKDILIQQKAINDARLEAQQRLNYLYFAILVFILSVTALIYRNYLQKKKMNVELQDLNENLEVQKNEVIVKNTEIMASIRYAERIQAAVLPFPATMQKHLEYFVFYRPKDIVSGDFYWFLNVKDVSYVAVADCTGHGVPGSMLTMIGLMMLDEAVSQWGITQPSAILDYMHTTLSKTLCKNNSEHTSDDGMDVAIIAINKKLKIVEFAGAKRPLYMVKNAKNSEPEILVIKGDKHSIGAKRAGKGIEFTNHIIDSSYFDSNNGAKDKILSGEYSVYLMSDGFIDQSNPDGKKYGSKNLQTLIEKISPLAIDKQQGEVEKEFTNHIGDESQRDDVTLLGIKLS